MRAISFGEFGSPSVLHTHTPNTPEPAHGQVLAAIRYAAVNPLDAGIRSGAMEQVFPTELPAIPGQEGAGVVVAVGEGAPFAVGDEVLGFFATGTYAEFALGQALIRKPTELPWEKAAALPTAAVTAARTLDELKVTDGDILLIHGASGVVGSMAVQLGKARGATVIGTASPAGHNRLKALGAVPVAYGDGLVGSVRAASGGSVDAILDAAGHGVLHDAIELRGGTDRIVTIADFGGPQLGIPFSAGGPPDLDTMAQVVELAARGELQVDIAKIFPLTEATTAHELIEHGHPGGKILLQP